MVETLQEARPRLRMAEISRALAKHDPNAAYTLLCEALPQGLAGRALVELIQTVPDWPKVGALHYPEQYLTPRELQVLRGYDEGLTTIEIAKSFPLSVSTVLSHKKHAFEKLDVHSIMAALHKARELGLL